MNKLFRMLAPLKYEQHPLFADERHWLDGIRDTLQSSESNTGFYKIDDYPLLKNWLAALTKPKIKSGKINIELNTGRIEGPNQSWSILSEDMCKAFALLYKQKDTTSIGLNDFFVFSFSVIYYEPDLHYRKIYNLLSRMKKLSGKAFDFKIRNNRLHFSIDQTGFEINESVRPDGYELLHWLKICDRIERNLSQSHLPASDSKKTVTIKPILKLHKKSSRQQIQAATGWSKSMTLREIKKLIKSGELRKQGRGKKSRYSLTKNSLNLQNTD